jgi:hypothetical protein
MRHVVRWTVLLVVWGAAAASGLLLSESKSDPLPAFLKCDGNSPRNCYCRTDAAANPPTSCYASGGPFYTCTEGMEFDTCNPTKAVIQCGLDEKGNLTGDKYTGACTGSGGPGPMQKKVGKCSYPEGSCK